jgi:hypothetical protein
MVVGAVEQPLEILVLVDSVALNEKDNLVDFSLRVERLPLNRSFYLLNMVLT